MNNHSHLVESVLIEAPKLDLIVWKQHTGSAYTITSVDECFGYLKLVGVDLITLNEARNRLRMMSYGVKGQADITGINKAGQRIEIECKTGKGKLSKEQENFQHMIIKSNGIYLECRSIGELKNI